MLLGLPIVEYAPCGRIPNGKIRKDARQGTIDQDPEFIDFLESLTNPTPKPTQPEGGSDTETKKVEAKVTPLIQYLRDRKANKSKDVATSGKSSKHSRNDSKDSKTSQGSDKKPSSKDTKESTQQADKRNASAIKAVKAAHDAVKLLNKQAHTSNKTLSPSSSTATPSAVPAQAKPPVATPDRKRERGTVSAAARIQRDLGLGGSPGGRRRRDAAASPATSNTTTSNGKPSTNPQPQVTIATNSTSSPSSVALPSSSRTDVPSNTPPSQHTPNQPPTGPAASRTIMKPQTSVPPRPQQAPSIAAPKPPPIPSTATQAFLKHANPSQGITEPLLEQVFTPFGSITKVEIDKKKGFAYIDFAEPEGLQKAMAASPVKVAQGQVVVLERKSGPTLQARNVRGGPAMGPGRGSAPPPMVPRGGRGGGGRGRGGTARSTPMRPATHEAPTANNTPGSVAAPSATIPVPESAMVSIPAPTLALSAPDVNADTPT